MLDWIDTDALIGPLVDLILSDLVDNKVSAIRVGEVDPYTELAGFMAKFSVKLAPLFASRRSVKVNFGGEIDSDPQIPRRSSSLP